MNKEIEKEIIILNSELVTYKFKDGRSLTRNSVMFALRDDNAKKDLVGYDTVLKCTLDPSSFDLTKDIKPYELVNAYVGFKKADDGKYKMVITEINGIDVR